MFNLFSSFDSSNYMFLGSLDSLLTFLLFSSFFLFCKINFSLSLVYAYLHDFFLSVMNSNSKMSVLSLLSFFFFFFFLNFSSIFPYLFSLTGHLYLLLPISLVLWLTVNIFSLFNSPDSFMIHTVPLGTPHYLVFFMVLVEFISNMIRPLTLSVRLMANIFSGHLLLLLLYGLVSLTGPTGLLSLFFFIFLCTVELFVSLIQSYIFCTLVYLYYTDLF